MNAYHHKFRLTLPKPFHDLLSVLKIFSFDLFGALRIGCVDSYSYVEKLYGAFTLPLALIVGVAAFIFARKQLSKAENAAAELKELAIKMSLSRSARADLCMCQRIQLM